MVLVGVGCFGLFGVMLVVCRMRRTQDNTPHGLKIFRADFLLEAKRGHTQRARLALERTISSKYFPIGRIASAFALSLSLYPPLRANQLKKLSEGV